ncbi:hypothetical protein Tco_0944825 [Tanacetum coccineum]
MSTPSNNSQMHNDIMAAVIEEQPVQPRRVEQETYANTTLEKRRVIDAEAKAIHMILNEISESINKQDVKTKLLWEFGKFNSKDGESIESYYSRIFDILNEANEIRAEKIAKNANPLALVVVAQHYLDNYSPDTYHQALKTHKPYAPSSRQTLSIRNHDLTKTKGKEITKLITPPSESPSKEKNVTPDSSDMCDNEGHADQNAEDPKDERVMLASLIANFKLDLDENKKSQRQLKKETLLSPKSLTKPNKILKKIKHDLEKSKQDIKKTKQDLVISKQNLTYSKSELEKYIMFQTNHQDKEKAELKCARALGLLEQTKRQHHESLKTQLLKTFCVKEENAKPLTKISAHESRISQKLKEK